MILSV
jgi:hypothetical protein